MKVLGIETSCDENAVAVVEDGRWILSNVVSSQIELHGPYGGVVPELASRHHMVTMLPVLDEALQAVGGLDAIDVVAVTNGPGLVGSLLVGVQTAKTLAWATGKPLVAVNHLHAHLYAPFIGWKEEGRYSPADILYPNISLLVSGGHTIIFRSSEEGMQVLGATRDDAAGEAFDKAAKLLGLGYPGGKVIDELAEKGDPNAIRFPRGMKGKPGFDMSFSGLKTALSQWIESNGVPGDQALRDLAASYRAAVIDTIIIKLRRVLERQTDVRALVVAGGVAANRELRRRASELAREFSLELMIPPISLCTDNAAMVAGMGYHLARQEEFSGLDLNAYATSLISRRGGQGGPVSR